jgi:hypothetical protein
MSKTNKPVGTMRLTRRMADDIVRVVMADKECRDRIGDSIFAKFPAGLGWGGSLRNISMIAQNKDPSEFENYRVVCTGIADATAKAIGAARLPFVVSAETTTRERPLFGLEFLGGVTHDATRINLTRFGPVVMDWHATLMVDNPLIFRDLPSFRADTPSVQYKEFKGV